MFQCLKHLLHKHGNIVWIPKNHVNVGWVSWPACNFSLEAGTGSPEQAS